MQPLTPILIDAGLRGLAILLLAALVTAAMRRNSAAARHLVWFLAVLAVLVMPALSYLLPSLAVLPTPSAYDGVEPVALAGQGVEPAPQLAAAASHAWAPNSSTAAGDMRASAASDMLPPPEMTPSVDHAGKTAAWRDSANPAAVATAIPKLPRRRAWLAWLSWTWLGGAALAMIPRVLGWLSLGHLRRTSAPVSNFAWQALLKQLKAEIRLKRPVMLFRSRSRSMPMTWGMFPGRSGAVVLIPEGAEAWSAERRRAVLLHELAHIKRRDCLTQMLTQVACALHWFNPLIWFAAHRMLIERERACDDLVLRHETKASDYAQHLLDIAASPPAEPVGFFAAHAGIAMARRSKLEGRVAAILDKQRNRGAMSRIGVTITIALIGVIVVSVAVLQSAGQPHVATPAPDTPELIAESEYAQGEPIPLTVKWHPSDWRLYEEDGLPDEKGRWAWYVRVNGEEYRITSGLWPYQSLTAGLNLAAVCAAQGRRLTWDPGKYEVTYVLKNLKVYHLNDPGHIIQTHEIVSNTVTFHILPRTGPSQIAASANAAVDAGSPFAAHLASGVTVELLGLAQHPSKDEAWWDPAGHSIESPPFSPFDGGVRTPHKRSLEVAARINGPTGESLTVVSGRGGMTAAPLLETSGVDDSLVPAWNGIFEFDHLLVQSAGLVCGPSHAHRA